MGPEVKYGGSTDVITSPASANGSPKKKMSPRTTEHQEIIDTTTSHTASATHHEPADETTAPIVSPNPSPKKETGPKAKQHQEVIDPTASPTVPAKASPEVKKDLNTEEWPALPGSEPRSRSSTLQSQPSPWGAKQRARTATAESPSKAPPAEARGEGVKGGE